MRPRRQPGFLREGHQGLAPRLAKLRGRHRPLLLVALPPMPRLRLVPCRALRALRLAERAKPLTHE
eukprot:12008837-Alexandrium_andersonii.AAC.1